MRKVSNMLLKKATKNKVKYPSLKAFSTFIVGVSLTVSPSCATNENNDSSTVTVPSHRKGDIDKNQKQTPPHLDSDGDGISDNVDKCPDMPEDKDGFQDEDGCPDLDNDGDGIPDTEDACPNEKGERNSYKKINGCPLAVRTAGVQMPNVP